MEDETKIQHYCRNVLAQIPILFLSDRVYWWRLAKSQLFIMYMECFIRLVLSKFSSKVRNIALLVVGRDVLWPPSLDHMQGNPRNRVTCLAWCQTILTEPARWVHAKNVRLTAPAWEESCVCTTLYSTVIQYTKNQTQHCNGSQEHNDINWVTRLTYLKRSTSERVFRESPWAELIVWSKDDTPEILKLHNQMSLPYLKFFKIQAGFFPKISA